MFSCNHICICEKCHKGVGSKCPMCREDVKKLLRFIFKIDFINFYLIMEQRGANYYETEEEKIQLFIMKDSYKQ